MKKSLKADLQTKSIHSPAEVGEKRGKQVLAVGDAEAIMQIREALDYVILAGVLDCIEVVKPGIPLVCSPESCVGHWNQGQHKRTD